MKTLLIILGLLGITYLGICAWLYFRQSALVFFPREVLENSPSDFKLRYEDFQVESSNGSTLYGWHVFTETDSTRGTILFCHGNGGNISHRLELISLWSSLGFEVFAFDYQGYGQSSGAPSEEATYADVRACWKYLTIEREIAPASILLLGRSLGAAVATHLAAELSKTNQPTPAGLILEAPFTSIPDMGARLYPFLPVRLLSRITYDNQANLAQIHLPVLFLHGVDDAITPITMGKKVYHSANEPKRFVALPGGHEDTFIIAQNEYSAALLTFADNVSKRR